MKKIIAMFFVAFFMVPSLTFAQTTVPVSITPVMSSSWRVQILEKLIALLQQELLVSYGQTTSVTLTNPSTITVINPVQPSVPTISSLNPGVSSGKDVDLITVTGTNFRSANGTPVYVDFLQAGVSKFRLSTTDSPTDVLIGSALTPADTTGTLLMIRLAHSLMPIGTYQVRVTTSGGMSNTMFYRVQ